MITTFRLLAFQSVSFYLRNVSLTWGRWRLWFYAVERAKRLGHLIGRRKIATRRGFRMDLDVSDWIGQHIYATGDWEPSTAEVIESLLHPGDTFVDVGANHGFFSLLAARQVGPSGRVIAFEPVPRVRERLQANVTLNQFHNVDVRCEAVSDHTGQVDIHVGPQANSGKSSIRRLAEDTSSLTVPTCTLDELLAATSPVSVVKIDIEGAELLALRGMQKLLETAGPDLVIEISDEFLREMGSSGEEVHRFLGDLGYRMFTIEWDGLVAVEKWHPGLTVQFNALFTKKRELPDSIHMSTSRDACSSN